MAKKGKARKRDKRRKMQATAEATRVFQMQSKGAINGLLEAQPSVSIAAGMVTGVIRQVCMASRAHALDAYHVIDRHVMRHIILPSYPKGEGRPHQPIRSRAWQRRYPNDQPATAVDLYWHNVKQAVIHGLESKTKTIKH